MTCPMERAYHLNNAAIYHMQVGAYHVAQQKLTEALRIAKQYAFSLKRDVTTITDWDTAAAAAYFSSNQGTIHSFVRIPALWDSNVYLCDQAIAIHPPPADLSTVTTDESILKGKRQDSSEHVPFVSIDGAIIIFNTALAFHAYGLHESSPQPHPWLANAQKLYQMARVMMLEQSDGGAFDETSLSIQVAATNNLVHVHASRGEHLEASQRLGELHTLLSEAASHHPNTTCKNGSILASIFQNVILISKASAAAAA
ncbi:hypothetical protein IV203_025704 [Nitzschia inconspicua]|uniref:Uncharacterized protein n=1 Tax=Nitzschia inconspicua TaxID=303405 RepID=A0A9K3PWA7_9STRA|nr:hypothetical protein IV203_025704 [Nitzschia inconspicua]